MTSRAGTASHTSRTYKAVVLLSGGLDSAYNLALAARYRHPVLAITFDYGHRAAGAERLAAASLCRHFHVGYRVIRLPWLGKLAPPAMVEKRYKLPRYSRDVNDLWVPNRNGIFVAIGAAFAEARGATAVIAGFNAEEAADFPDNSPFFIAAANRSLFYSTQTSVQVVSYTAALDKTTIARRAAAVGVPLELIYPCYGDGPAPCGDCLSCRRTGAALKAAGLGAISRAVFARS